MADDNSNTSDYSYIDDVTDIDPDGSKSPESWWWTDHLPELVWTGILMFLFLVSLVANLMTIVTIFRHRELHTGYFVLHIFFSSVHIIYFLLSLFHRATFTLIQFNLLDSLIPGDSLVSMMDIVGSVDDLNQCLLGLQILLLCTLTIDCCFTLSRKYSSKPKCQGALRTLFSLASFLTFGSAFSVMALLRFTELLSSGHEIDDEIWPILIRCGLQIFLFICNPVFVIVIVGVVNCVTQRHSTRLLYLANDLARQLDFRHGLTASILLIVWMAERIITMAVDIEAYEDDQNLMVTLNYCRYGLGIAVSLLASVFPLSAVCVLGRLCCCCSKKYSEKHEF